MTQLEFELAYDIVTVQLITHYTPHISCSFISDQGWLLYLLNIN